MNRADRFGEKRSDRNDRDVRRQRIGCSFDGVGDQHLFDATTGLWSHVKNPNGPSALTYAWIGPFVGALIRPVGGWVSDKVGGSIVTQVISAVMIAASIYAGYIMMLAYHSATPEIYFTQFLLTFVVLLYFMFPALLEGRDPLAVAVVSASGLVLILLYTAHGLSIRTSVAVLGTLFGIALTALISYLVVGVGNFSGISSDDDFLLAGVTQIRLDGLLLAGIIFASVGVLNDVTVTQASSVWELKESQPNYSDKELFDAGMRIG